jgi:Protein of unknown function (DUF3301)
MIGDLPELTLKHPMELGWSALALMCIAAAVVWFWQDSLAARERANRAAGEACQRLGLQLLDGSVAFAALRFTRNVGQLTFRRTYVFDYTADSVARRQGFVVLTGRRIDSVGFERDETSQSQQLQRASQTPHGDNAEAVQPRGLRARPGADAARLPTAEPDVRAGDK